VQQSFTFATARLLPFWWLHAMVTEGMLEELVVKVITPDSDIGTMVP